MRPAAKMIRAAWRILLVLLAGLPLSLPAGALAADAVIGVLAHRGDAAARDRWQKTVDRLNADIEGWEFSMLPLSLAGVDEALVNGTIDFLLTNPGHFGMIADTYRLTPIASLRTDRAGAPTTGNRYGAVILVRADRTDIRSLIDLRGKTFAAVAPEAFGGFLIAAHTLRRNGVDPQKDLKAIVYKGFPQDRIVLAVLDGEVDAGTVRTGVIESMIRQGRIRGEDLTVLNPQSIAGFDFQLSTDLYPEWTLAAAHGTAGALRRKVAMTLLAVKATDAAALDGRYGGWDTPMYDGKVREVIASEVGRPEQSGGIANGILVALAATGLGVVIFAILLFRRVARRATQSGQLAPVSQRPDNLTRRESEVLDLVISGMTNKEIARALSISPKTVEFHRRHLMEKFEASNVAELIRKALEPAHAG
ncbi:MAG: PhnD/SsuA/transferrin family substrate-binding protein [Hyphomicrobiales bacterium]|nr:PhnD/SsuA/transferrin family substrate-binding protein [Hyphomicrobiales bacterium]